MPAIPPELVETWAQRILGIMRIVAGLLFFEFGLAKLFGWPHVAMFDNLRLFSLLGAAGVIELGVGSS
jgi:putative oxidoreductase